MKNLLYSVILILVNCLSIFPFFIRNSDLDAWARLNEGSVLSYEDVVNQVIWNNTNVTNGKASIFDKKLMRKGIVTIGDLLSDAGVFQKSVNVLNATLSPVAFFKLIGIVDAIPSEWRLIIKQSTQHTPK